MSPFQMEITSMDWKNVMEKLLATYYRKTIVSLENIKMARKRVGLPFNAKFKEYFLNRSTDRIKHAFDQFEMDSFFEEEYNHTEASGSSGQSVGLIIESPEANNSSTEANQIIEIDDESDDETIHINSKTSMGASNDRITINGTPGRSANVFQTGESVANEMANLSSALESVVAANPNEANRVEEFANRSSLQSGSNHLKVDEDIAAKIQDFDALVLVEVNRKLIAPPRNIAYADVNNTKKSGSISSGDEVIQIDDSDDEDVATEEPQMEAVEQFGQVHPNGLIDVGRRSIRQVFVALERLDITKMTVKVSNYESNTTLGKRRNPNGNSIGSKVRNTGDKPYGCNRCGKRFKHVCDLKRHALIHTDIFPFRCMGCYGRFSQKAEKEAHDKGCVARRYECHPCKNYVNHYKFLLKRHMKTHTGEKPFRCEICTRQFSLKENLRRHLLSVHGKTL